MRTNTEWFRRAGWGLIMHFLAAPASSTGGAEVDADAWNRTVDAFDVDGLSRQLAEVGAGYLLLTLGQNSGHYCAPNATYDSLVPNLPSKLARRDLVADLYQALNRHGVRLMVYLPSHAPAVDRVAVEGLRCTPRWDASAWQLRPGTYLAGPDVDERLSAFQRNWEAVIREWSRRWGTNVHGWWFDGCYFADRMYRHPDAPNFQSFAAAAKAANPESLVAFNPGTKFPVISVTEEEDYTAGEIDGCWAGFPMGVPPYKPLDGTVKGAQLHILTYLGEAWGRGAPRFPDELVIGYTRHVNACQGVITWDVPPTATGLLAEPFVRLLGRLDRRNG